MASLISGGRGKVKHLKWKAHERRFENLLVNNIYLIKNSDISIAKTPALVKDINKDRFSIMRDEDDFKKKLDTIIKGVNGWTITKKGREQVMIRLIAILKVTLFEQDVMDILEGQILEITEIMTKVIAESRMENVCLRDINIRQLPQETQELLLKLRDIFTNMIYEIIVQYIKLSTAWEEKKKALTDIEFKEKLPEFDERRILQTMASLTAELAKYKEPVPGSEEKDQVIMDLKKKLKEQQDINDENEQKLNNASEPSKKKRKISQHLRDAIHQLQGDEEDVAASSILNQINTDNKGKSQRIDVNVKDQDEDEDIDMNDWLNSSMNPPKGNLLSDTINGMVKKMDRLSGSQAISNESMLDMIHAGKYKK